MEGNYYCKLPLPLTSLFFPTSHSCIYAQGEWNVFEDACPHRLAALSEGRIDENTGNLMCTYHGWTFDSAGKCTNIPQSSPKEMKSEYHTVATTTTTTASF